MDHPLFRSKMLAVAQAMNGNFGSAVIRPSSIGNCPARLWHEEQRRKAGESRPARDPEFAWYALQGQFFEALMIIMLQQAGAEVLEPPDLEHTEDSESGMETPHADGLIKWPAVFGNDGWYILELKYLRALAQIDLAVGGLYAERGYWYQGVAYYARGEAVIDLYAEIEQDGRATLGGAWTKLQMDKVVPRGIAFLATAKDPSSMNMLFRGMSTAAKYEDNPDKMTPSQVIMAEKKAHRRDRMELLGGGIEFFLDLIEGDEEEVHDTIGDINLIAEQAASDTRPEPLHDSTVEEDDLDTECRWYCDFFDECVTISSGE